MQILLPDDLGNLLLGDPKIGAQFVYGEQLVLFLFELGFNLPKQGPGITFTPSGEEHNIFWVDADTVEGFHTLTMLHPYIIHTNDTRQR